MSSHSFPTSIDSLILPSASQNFSQTLSSLKRSRLSIKNRLASIYEDSQFVQHVSELCNLPLVANERCGSWYIPTENKVGSAYFKSTDGHQGQWKFSLRRLNLQVLEIVGKNSGCIIVDSTRSGKSMPDALSKTIPIWCSVINRLLFPDDTKAHMLWTPPEVVGRSEHVQIEERLAGFLENVKELQLDVARLRATVGKPLRPLWITRSSVHSLLALLGTVEPEYLPLVCCTASRQESDAGDGYIQGAGDDSEGWAQGLTPEIFWRNSVFLLSTDLRDNEDIPTLLQKLKLDRAGSESSSNVVTVYRSIAGLPIYISALDNLSESSAEIFDGIITCDEQVISSSPGQSQEGSNPRRRLCLNCKTGKHGSRSLRNELPRLKPFIQGLATCGKQPRLLFACKTGKDLSVGMALTALCLYFDDNGIFHGERTKESITKNLIRRRLSWIMAAKPDSNPVRATLQSVNAFLMEKSM